MKDSFLNRVNNYFSQGNQWLFQTANRALEEAYKAAIKIKTIEDEHFGGNAIVFSVDQPNSIKTYFQADLTKYLIIIKIRLAEFQTSRTITNNYYNQLNRLENSEALNTINPYIQDVEVEARILEKLRFIDQVLSRYSDRDNLEGDITHGNSPIVQVSSPVSEANNLENYPIQPTNNSVKNPSGKKSRSNNIGLIDPSLIRIFKRVRKDLDPNSEKEIVASYRTSQSKTKIALRFLLLLILVPLLTQYISKIILVGPLVDYYRSHHQSEIFLNVNLEEEALGELEHYEKRLRFESIVGIAPTLTDVEREERIREKAEEIRIDFFRKSAEAVKNWFADIISFIATTLFLIRSKREINVLKSFIDELIYGLSDTAKAFIIILFTDTFVGFHSPHGWEIILLGVAKHLGIPENEAFNSLFIATFPVLLDTIFKYWIFRYLSGQSPSAVATYKTMNE